jgi:hypothetical protein
MFINTISSPTRLVIKISSLLRRRVFLKLISVDAIIVFRGEELKFYRSMRSKNTIKGITSKLKWLSSFPPEFLFFIFAACTTTPPSASK